VPVTVVGITAVGLVISCRIEAFLASRNRVFYTLAKNGLDIAIDGAKPVNETERQNLVRFALDEDIAHISVNGEIIIEREKPGA